jgi:hypothetical protein
MCFLGAQFNPMQFNRFLTTCCAALLLLPVSSTAEGGKNLTPGNNAVTNYTQSAPLNNTIGFLQNGDNSATNNYTGFFLYNSATTGVFAGDPAYTADHRLKIRIRPGETLYYGLQRTDGQNAVTIVIKAMVLGVETILQSTTLAATNTSINTYGAGTRTVGILNCGQAGVICTRAQMNAGPAAIVGASGYNALSVSLPGSVTAPTDMWVELLDDAGGVCVYDEKDVYDLWDFSVYDGTTEKTGRLHSKFWSFQAMTGGNRLSENFILYPAIPNDAGNAYFIKGLNLRGMQPFGFSFVCNATGTLTNASGVATTDFRERRKSKLNFSGIRTDIYTQYDIFVADPDSLFWPTGNNAVPILPFSVNTWCADPATGRGALAASVLFLYPANMQFYGEFNGTPGYQPLSSDVLFELNRSSGIGQIFWDGRDGLGNIVPSGTLLSIRYRVQRYPVHFPIYDPENNDLGYQITDYRPSLGTTGIVYWDDTNLVPGSSSLIGTTSASGVHPWGGSGTGILAPNRGNTNLMNTWTYGAEREMPLSLPFVFRCDTDNDGDDNFNDIDDDDDGITDKDESNGIDPLLDDDADGIINYLDVSYPGYVDVNFDGVNDNFDKDGDRIINELDLDSDNDGIADVVEAYGVDADGNGRIDNYSDTDNDGLSENVDRAVGETGSLGLGLPDLDSDGLPNYLDRDSDNDGIPDIIEAEGPDGNNDALTDQLIDNNSNGLLDPSPALMESFADADFDGWSNAFDGDADGNSTVENVAGVLLRTGGDANNDGRADNYPFKNFDKEGRPDAYDLDSDNDGITDVREAGFADGNNDGMSDGVKGSDGWDNAIDALMALSFRNTDSNTTPDYKDIDSDDDGIPDNVESMSTAGYALPANTDTDGDGLDDSYDAVNGFGGGGNTPYDRDSDGLPDYLDNDTDGDGIADIYEGNDFNFNGQVDDVFSPAATDADGDGLIDFFDNNNSSVKGTSAYMGNAGSLTGDAAPGSITTVQRHPVNNCAFERDWRCMSYVLPVQQLQLQAQRKGRAVELTWYLQTGGDAEQIVIERSGDGRSFATLYQMPVQSNHSIQGTTTDASASVPHFLYYRLRIRYRNGRELVTKTVVVKGINQEDFIILLSNPVSSGKIELILHTSASVSVRATLVNQSGQQVLQRSVSLHAGSNSLTIVTDFIPKGLYHLTIRAGDKTWKEKVLIQ